MTFATQEAAVQASRAEMKICGFAFLAWNDRPYNDIDQGGEGRGWCVCEEGVSMELITRLEAYPKMKSVLETLPPHSLLLLAAASSGQSRRKRLGVVDIRALLLITCVQRAILWSVTAAAKTQLCAGFCRQPNCSVSHRAQPP